MGELFVTVLYMSLAASYVILVVMIVRLLLKKAPKSISYALWSVVAFRLLVPFSFKSMFSLMPRKINEVSIPYYSIIYNFTIPDNIIHSQSAVINGVMEAAGSIAGNYTFSDVLTASPTAANVDLLRNYLGIGAYIWILGIIALVAYSLVSILLIKRQLKDARLIEGNVFEANNLRTPFVLGFIKPRIYLPTGIDDEEKGFILLHERTHIRRKDYLVKLLAFTILAVHWFNPLVWIAFVLMSTDMEQACDERVLKEMGGGIKKPYANSLLSFAAGRRILNGSPLAFGEGNAKTRIINVLNYKKPKFWVIALAIISVTAIGFGLVADPVVNPVEVESKKGLSPSEESDPTEEVMLKTDISADETVKHAEGNIVIALKDFKYDGNDPIEELIYATEIEKYAQPGKGFTVIAPRIFGAYEEEEYMRVFVTTYSATYKLDGNELNLVSGSVVPSAITYKKDKYGNYVLEKYEQAKDGADWKPSIEEFCTMPVSGKKIPGLAEKIIDHYSKRDDLELLMMENLAKHLKENGITGSTVVLVNSDGKGKVEFAISIPEYEPSSIK